MTNDKRQVVLTLGLLFILIGCHKHQIIPLAPLPSPQEALTPSVKSKVILLAGQSNSRRMSTDSNGLVGGEQGIADAFGKQPVLILNCAMGGTSIREWSPGGSLYNACIEMAMPYKIDAVFWYQGETDATVDGAYQTWAPLFTSLVRALRVDLGPVKVVYAQLSLTSQEGFKPHWQEVKDQQASVYLEGAAMLKTDTLSPSPLDYDGVHYSPAGYYNLGQKFVESYNGIEEN